MPGPALLPRFAPAALLALGAGLFGASGAEATTHVVSFSTLSASATVASTMFSGDILHLDTAVTTETGALQQVIFFTTGADVRGLTGQASWVSNKPFGTDPRLIDVNIDIFAVPSGQLVASDFDPVSIYGTTISQFSSAFFNPGSYRMVITGTAVRDAFLDVTLSVAVPEPGTYALMLAGGGLVALRARRRCR